MRADATASRGTRILEHSCQRAGALAHNVAPPEPANRGPHTRVAPIQVAAGDSAQFTDPDGNLVGLVKGMRQRN